MATRTTTDQDVRKYTIPKYLRRPAHWARPARRAVGDEKAEIVFLGVGYALTRWELVELSCSILVNIMVDSHTVAAERAYGTIQGARSRAAALRQIGDVYFGTRQHLMDQRRRDLVEHFKTHASMFSALVDNYVDASNRRNDIAHGIVWNLTDFDKRLLNHFLVAPLHQSQKNKAWIRDDVKLRSAKGMTIRGAAATAQFAHLYAKHTDYMYTSADLKVLGDKFQLLSEDLGSGPINCLERRENL